MEGSANGNSSAGVWGYSPGEGKSLSLYVPRDAVEADKPPSSKGRCIEVCNLWRGPLLSCDGLLTLDANECIMSKWSPGDCMWNPSGVDGDGMGIGLVGPKYWYSCGAE